MFFSAAITCLSIVCAPLPTMNGFFTEKKDCEKYLAVVYKGWQPRIGAYSFNCKPYDPFNAE